MEEKNDKTVDKEQYINASKKQLYRKNKISHIPLHTNAVQRSKFPYQKTEISTENTQKVKKLQRVMTGFFRKS